MTVDRGDHRRKGIVIVGGHRLACAILEALVRQGYNVVLCVLRADDRGEDGIFPSLAARARALGIPFVQPEDFNAPDLPERAVLLGGELVLSLENNRLFKEPWLTSFSHRLRIVNAHFSPLPRYGGYWPEMWAIWNEEKDYGVTIHYVSRRVDAGEIIAQYPVTIADGETRRSLYEKCIDTTLQMVLDRLAALLCGPVPAKEQDLTRRTYFGRELPNGGFVDLTWGPEKIERFFRAMSFYPFPGPKIRIGQQVISTLDEDIPFFRPVTVRTLEP
jgi:methionyl-tRNA formyltransferase